MVKFRWETEFKETEIGKIPKDWEVKQLKYAVKSLESGKRPKGGKLNHNPNGILNIGAENISWDGSLVLDNCFRVDENFYNNAKKGKIEKDDILLVKDGATIGKLSYISKIPENKAMVNEHVFIIKTNKNKANSRFIYFCLFSEIGQQQIDNLINGINGGINKSILDFILLPYPPLQEQEKIATILLYFDDLIENKKKQNEILEKMALEIFKNWFIDFEPFKDEEFVYNEDLDKEIPKGWEVKKLKDLNVYILRGVSFKSSEGSFKRFSGSIPIIRANNIKEDGSLDLSDLMYVPKEKIPNEKILKEKDLVLVASSGSRELVGKIGLVINIKEPLSFGAFLYTIRTKEKNTIWNLLYTHLKSDIFMNYMEMVVDGTNINNLSKNDLENFCIIIPPQPILEKFNSLVQPLFEKIINNQKQIMVLKKIRDTLLPKLVFGELRVEEL